MNNHYYLKGFGGFNISASTGGGTNRLLSLDFFRVVFQEGKKAKTPEKVYQN